MVYIPLYALPLLALLVICNSAFFPRRLGRCAVNPHRGILSKPLSDTESSRVSTDPAVSVGLSVLIPVETGSGLIPSVATGSSSGPRSTPFCLSFAGDGLSGAAFDTQSFRSASRRTASSKAVETSSCLSPGIRSCAADASVSRVVAGWSVVVSSASRVECSLGSSAFGRP